MKNPEVDWFFNKKGPWQDAYLELRSIVLSCGLTEELKWGCPCYTLNEANVVLIHGFKDYCALLLMQGALLKDTHQLLVQQTTNVQAARQIRFTGVEDVISKRSIIKAYVKAAVTNQKQGLKVKLKATAQFDMVGEFKSALKEYPGLKKAFSSLTPGRQRGYLLYFSSAKQTSTRMQRIEKCIPRILEHKGLEDK
ncbi:MAG: YdeI/OmpD-associated family protein [Cyclobacteriaceae bacterium]|nr:YdeI/OmpD-associated family protein [Cyclobacteriaceae bacterium]